MASLSALVRPLTPAPRTTAAGLWRLERNDMRGGRPVSNTHSRWVRKCFSLKSVSLTERKHAKDLGRLLEFFPDESLRANQWSVVFCGASKEH